MKNDVFGDRKKHPSYGLLGISRYSGRSEFFMSPIRHDGGITLTIRTAYKCRELNSDYVFGDEQLIEVSMSDGQFARAITSLNQGDGVPCTITWLPEVGRIPPEAVLGYRETYDKEVGDVADEAIRQVLDVRKFVEGLRNKASVSKKDLEQLASLNDRVLMSLRSNLPFMLKRFTEAMDKVETAAKSEILATIERGLRSAGIEAIKDRLAGGLQALLPGKDEDPE